MTSRHRGRLARMRHAARRVATTAAVLAVALSALGAADRADGSASTAQVMLGVGGLEVRVQALAAFVDGPGTRIVALADDLPVEGLLGPAGAGKSTLTRILSGRLEEEEEYDESDFISESSAPAAPADASVTPDDAPSVEDSPDGLGAGVPVVQPLDPTRAALWLAISENELDARHECAAARLVGARLSGRALIEVHCPDLGAGRLQALLQRWLQDPDAASGVPRRVSFDPGSDELSTEQRRQLRELGDLLSGSPGVEALVSGSAASDEPDPGALARRRADRIRGVLRDQGIAEGRLHAVSYGDLQPIAGPEREEAWARNRRGRIVFLSPTVGAGR